jgi:RHS repeat-associated core domain
MSLFLFLVLFSVNSLAQSVKGKSFPFADISKPIYTYTVDGQTFYSNKKDIKIKRNPKGISYVDFGNTPIGQTSFWATTLNVGPSVPATDYQKATFSGNSEFVMVDDCGKKGLNVRQCFISVTLEASTLGAKTGEVVSFSRIQPSTVWQESRYILEGNVTPEVPPPNPAPNVNKPLCEEKKKGSIIRADSLSFGEEIPVIGTDFSLVYSSEYAPEYVTSYPNIGRNGNFNPEWWTYSIQHFYDVANERIFLGSGVSYPKPHGTYDGKIMVVNGSEVYLFDSSGKHLKTLSYLTGYTKYEFGYNSVGRLISITDAYGNITTINRAGGSLSSIVGPYGQTTAIDLDSKFRISRVTIPSGDSYKLSYKGESGLLTNFETPAGRKTSVTYGYRGRLVSNRTGGSGWNFQTSGKVGSTNTAVFSQKSTMNREWTNEQFNYGANRYYKVSTSPSGLKTYYYEEPDGSSSTVTPIGTISNTRQEDPRFGNLNFLSSGTWMISGGKQQGSGQVQWVEGATANPFDYESLNINQNNSGYIENSYYDRTDNEVTSMSDGGVERRIKFNSLEQVVEAQLGSDVPVTSEYDQRGRLIKISQGQNREIAFSYDMHGNLYKIVDPLGMETKFEYNSNRDLTKITDPAQRTTGFFVDGDGRSIQIVSPNSTLHSLYRNEWGYLSAYVPPPHLGTSDGQISYFYNSDKQLVRINSLGLHPTDFYYNSNGQVSKVSRGEKTQTYEYSNTDGLLKNSKSFDGIHSTYKYVLDKVEQVINKDIFGTVYSKLRIAYDVSLYPLKKIFETDYFSKPHVIDISYDSDYRPVKVGKLFLQYEVGSGRLKGTVLNSIEDQYNYNSYGMLSSYWVGKRSSNQSLELVYSYNLVRDAKNRITEKIEVILGKQSHYKYFYDLSDQLVLVKKNGNIIGEFTYDLNGNILARKNSSSTISATYDSQDRLVALGQTQYSYNSMGDLATIQRSLTPDLFLTYSPVGDLKKVQSQTGNSTEFFLESGGQRSHAFKNGKLIYKNAYENAYRMVAQLDVEKSTSKKFVHATRVNTPDYMELNGGEFRIISNHLGSPLLVVNANTGQVIQKVEYDVWGKIIEDTNPGIQPYGFAGGLYDPDLKLVKFGARDYDPETGRWIKKDPILFDGGQVNLYVYANNDPINWTDPSGLKITFRDRQTRIVFNKMKNSLGLTPFQKMMLDQLEISKSEISVGQGDNDNCSMMLPGLALGSPVPGNRNAWIGVWTGGTGIYDQGVLLHELVHAWQIINDLPIDEDRAHTENTEFWKRLKYN